MPFDYSLWISFLSMGILNNVIPFCFIVWGQHHIASGLASILNATTPFFTVIVAHFATTDEKNTVQKCVGIVAGFLGVTMMIGSDMLSSLGTDVFAQLAVVVVVFSYALAGVSNPWVLTRWLQRRDRSLYQF